MASPWMTERQAAEFLGLHRDTLRRRRTQGKAPRHERTGRAVRYNVADVRRYRDTMSLREAADYLRVGYETLALWNRLGKGPACEKRGRRYFYRAADLDGFLRGA